MKAFAKRKRQQGATGDLRHLPAHFLLRRLLSSTVRDLGKLSPHPVSALKFASNRFGPLLLIGGDEQGGISLWLESYSNSERLLQPLSFNQAHDDSINGMATSPTQPRFLTCSNDHTVKLWHLEQSSNCLCTFRGHTSFVNSCHFDDTGKLMASVSSDSTLRIWHEDSTSTVFLLQMSQPATQVRFMPNDFHVLVTASREGACLWDLRNHSSYMAFIDSYENEAAYQQAEDPVSREFLSSELGWEDVWSSTWSSNFSLMESPNMSNTGSNVDIPAICITQQLIPKQRIFDKHLGIFRYPFQTHKSDKIIYSAVPTHSGRHIITSATDNLHKVWDAVNFAGLGTLEGASLSHYTESVLFSDDSFLVSGSSDGGLYFWPVFLTDGNVCGHMAIHSYPITAVCVSDDDTVIVSADEGGSLRLIGL